MSKPKMILTTVPFSGFYESLHSEEIELQFRREFENDSGDLPDRDSCRRAFDKIEFATNLGDVESVYAREYVAAFARELGDMLGQPRGKVNKPVLQFESMSSPREYNFTTDRIFAEIPLAVLRLIYKRVDKDSLAAAIKERFTSRSGFISYYKADVAEWNLAKRLASKDCDLDHNEAGVILEVFYKQESDHEFDSLAEFYLMESALCNGVIHNAIWEAIPESHLALANLLADVARGTYEKIAA